MKSLNKLFRLAALSLCIAVQPILTKAQTVTPMVAAGDWHSLGLKSDGTVWAWGCNMGDNFMPGSGQLGIGSEIDHVEQPVQVSGLTNITAIAAGGDHSLALKNDGTVWMWGRVPASSPSTNNLTPVHVPGLTNVTAIAAGNSLSLALKSDGTVWVWGWCLGDNTINGSITPVQVKGENGNGFLTDVKAIAAGETHALVLKNDGTVWAWGVNSYHGYGSGQLGDGTTTDRWAPVQVKGENGNGFLTGVTAIAAGGTHSLAMKSDGSVWSWGYKVTLGDGGISGGDRPTPATVIGINNPNNAAITAGCSHSLVLKNDGTVEGWGFNGYGQLGVGSDNNNYSTPERMHNMSNVRAFAGGEGHSVLLKNDGSVWTVGGNRLGQLGDGTDIHKLEPVQVVGPGGTGWLNLGAASQQTCAVITAEKIRVYPNPTTGLLHVTDALQGIEIVDVLGRIVVVGATHALPLQSAITLDISHLPAGVYFVALTTETGKTVKKIIKE